jgi:hypothetical protein
VRGVGPGTVLGGRYTVHERLEQIRDTERWTADDTTLGRSVSILVMAAGDHRTPALLDAARRAASVSHSVFVRILDVGSDDDVAFVVEEDLAEARTLGRLVADGGIPADEVRRITGEVAAALESARRRGMHHLDLTPDDVLRTPEGEVRLRGLEVAAARAGEEATDADEAARKDAVGVVALTYAGLTGLWPLGAGGSGLGLAPRVPGGVAAPSEIAAGVPRDLDALCRLTLNDDQGPTSPGDYARQVAPWSSRQVIGRPVVPMAMAPVSTGEPAATAAAPTAQEPAVPPAAPGAEGAPVRPSAEESAATPAPSLEAPATPATAPPRTPPAGDGAPGPHDAGTAAPPADEAPPRSGARRGLAAIAGLAGAAGAAAGAAGAGMRARTSGSGTRTDHGDDAPESPVSSPPGPPARQDPPPAWLTAPAAPGRSGSATAAARSHTRPTTADTTEDRSLVPTDESTLARREDLEPDGDDEQPGGTAAVVAGALGTVGQRVSTYARRAVDKVSELSPDTQRVEPPDGAHPDEPAPMVMTEPLTRDESKLALAIVAAFLVLALVVGLYGVSRIGKGSTDIFGPASGPVTRTTTVAPSSEGSSTVAEEEGEGSGTPEPLAILKVQAYDPEGDGYEHDELVGKTFDGDPDTGWYTESYSSSEFGGLKDGVGLIVDLGPNEKPQQVVLDIPYTSGLEVWVGPDASLDGATKVGEEPEAQGRVTVDVPEDVSGQYIVLWYTKVYPDTKGDIRSWLNVVTVLG